MTALLGEFEDLLTEEIYERGRSYKTVKQVYCLAINYGSDPASGFIPTIGLGETARQGEDVPPPSAARSDESWWNPAEFSSFGRSELQPKSPRLLDCDACLRLLASQDDDFDLRELCNRVAVRLNRLNRLDWEPLPITARFVVFAVDHDLVDLVENLELAGNG